MNKVVDVLIVHEDSDTWSGTGKLTKAPVLFFELDEDHVAGISAGNRAQCVRLRDWFESCLQFFPEDPAPGLKKKIKVRK